ncbi:metal ABC transporter ATP-binding protein [Jeotgalicoccus meleagridis]|uniref:Putative ABC transporter ATP-binding protein n=1 Tax=Jeotgalicoccus meleagridis TaxID=2759181 RepID=A0A6V7R095_9STAP|nr:metal ABC transporter ATP-binding protein [Jeotgalicoccus meleagridis]CAD2070615.1 putative ABC transporter ATP-binding protein [Jeotgalicoccus meleagridis]HIW38734.1 metal ABC transporter ATP-binding protein [Candidatus Jeotgalicoccus stercoravium]
MFDYAIETQDLTVAYQGKIAIENINLKLKRASRTAIVGPNGAGKSTLIKAILSLEKRVTGQVSIEGDDSKKARQKIAYVPQKGDVNWDFPTTVLDVVIMGRYSHMGWFKRPSKEDKDIALNALKAMKMIKFKDRQISQLSGGQRQRVFLARAMAEEADIYIMDEPLQGIDIKTEALIMETIKNLQEKGKTFLIVHHNISTVPDYFDHVIMLNQTIQASGSVNDVLTEGNIKNTYYEMSDE